MKIRFHFTQKLRAPYGEVVLFFSDVNNLKRVSPSFPRMEIVAPSTIVNQGSEFLLKIHFGLFVLRWVSVIDEVGPGGLFTDSFRGSVFQLWRHTHTFKEIPGGSLVIDDIECVPAWWFVPFTWLFVQTLFIYRRKALKKALS